MNKRHYQLLALAILIGAPMLVSMLTGMLPHGEAMLPANEAAPERPDYLQPAADPIAALPVQALPDPPAARPNNAPPVILAGGATLDPTPSLDPSAGALGGVEPAPVAVVATSPDAAPPPPQPAMTMPAMAQQSAPPANMMPKFREGPLRPY